MKKCRNCIHKDICLNHHGFMSVSDMESWIGQDCSFFENKARFIELPCNKINATVESNIYDEEETYYDCTVQVLRNSITGETSVGWFRNDEPPVLIGDD